MLELEGILHKLAGLNASTQNRGVAGAANAYAGTTGLELVGALNAKAGNAPGRLRDFDGVCNQLAGTVGWAGVGALNKLGAVPPDPPEFVPPVALSITPNNGPAAGGTPTVVLMQTPVPDATGILYGGVRGTGFIVTNPTQPRATTPPGGSGALVNVVVETPGGYSNPVQFQYGVAVPPSGPVLDSLSQDTVYANTLTDIYVEGSGFTVDSVITFDGVDQYTNYNGPTEVYFTTQAPIPTTGAHTIAVRDPSGTSNSLTLTAQAPLCSVTACSPPSYPSGPGQLLTVTGTMFGAGGADANGLQVVRLASDGSGWSGYACTGFTRPANTTLTGTPPANLPQGQYYCGAASNNAPGIAFLSATPLLTIA